MAIAIASELNLSSNPGFDLDQEILEEEQIGLGLELDAREFDGFHVEIKSAQEEDEEWVIEGYASTKEPDREGEFIPPEAFDLSQYNGVLLYNHGRDPEVGRTPVGKITHWILDKEGLWVRGVLTKAHKYARQIWAMIKEGILNSLSVGAPTRLVRKAGNRITYWPIAEISIVSVPAQPNATFAVAQPQSYKSLEEIEQAPLGLSVSTSIPSGSSSDSDFSFDGELELEAQSESESESESELELELRMRRDEEGEEARDQAQVQAQAPVQVQMQVQVQAQDLDLDLDLDQDSGRVKLKELLGALTEELESLAMELAQREGAGRSRAGAGQPEPE